MTILINTHSSDFGVDWVEQDLYRIEADNLNSTPVALTGKRNVNLSFIEDLTGAIIFCQERE